MESTLLLDMIANPKKMQRSATSQGFSSTSFIIKEAFQILEAKAMANEMVKNNPKDFADFLIRNSDEIVGTFERRCLS